VGELVLFRNCEGGGIVPENVVALLTRREVVVLRSGFMLVTPIVSSE
jgi:hypothetical protein